MASNYGAIGSGLTRQNLAISAANMDASPDYTKIANEAIKGRSQERRAAIEAEAQVHRAGIKGLTQVKGYELKAETEKAVADIKRPAKRMAGIVSAAGTLTGAWMLNKSNKEAEARALELEAKRDARHKQTMEALNKPRPKPEPVEKPPVMEMPTLYKPGDPLPSGKGSGTGSGSGAASTPPASGSTPSSGSTPAQGRTFTQQEGYQLLIDQGMDPQNARIGAAVMMGESSGRSWVRSSPELEKRTGELSVGLWQHNKNTGEDRHAFYGIKDWSELKDPVVNARATYRLWKRAGKKWTDWGAFTDGSYQDYL